MSGSRSDFQSEVNSFIDTTGSEGTTGQEVIDLFVHLSNDVPFLEENDDITAQWNFAPTSAQAPFTLGSNAQGEKVTGLNADLLDGSHLADIATVGDDQTITGNWTFEGTTKVLADTFYFQDQTDTSKQFQFDASGLTSGVTRTYTVPDKDGTVALLSDLSSLSPSDVGLGNVTNEEQVVDEGGSPSILSDLLANRPAAGTKGRLFVSTDTREVYRDTGSEWEALVGGSGTTQKATNGLELLSSKTASNSSSVQFTNLSDRYDSYLLVITDLVAGTAGEDLGLQIAANVEDPSTGTYEGGTDDTVTETFYTTDGGDSSSDIQGLEFGKNGDKLYLADAANLQVLEYDLGTSYDVTTATHANTLDISGTVVGVTNIKLGQSGAKLYILDGGSDRLYQWSLSTSWDTSTASFDASFDYTDQSTNMKCLEFKGGGDKLYLGSSGEVIYQYTLSTTWDVSTASYDSVSQTFDAHKLDGSDMAAQITDLEFAESGQTLVITDGNQDGLFIYDLSTGYDLSTASFNNEYYIADDLDDSAAYSAFNDTGTLCITAGGAAGDPICELTLDVGWTLSQSNVNTGYAYQSISHDFSPESQDFWNVDIKPDGTKLIVVQRSSASFTYLWEYDLTTAWDITTVSYTGNNFNANQDGYFKGIAVSDDGLNMILANGGNMYSYSMTTGWDLSTASYDTVSYDVTTDHSGADVSGISKANGGAEMYLLDRDNSQIIQYTLSTSWDLSTASSSGTGGLSNTDERDLSVKEDGTVAIVSAGDGGIESYTFGTAYDVTTLSYDSNRTSVAQYHPYDPNRRWNITVKEDGSIIHLLDLLASKAVQLEMSTSWDPSSVTDGLTPSFDLTNEDSSPEGTTFNDDGTTMFMVGSGTDTVYEYSLSTAWDITSASYTGNSFGIGTEDGTPREIIFRPDGSKFFILGDSNDTVYAYDLSTDWDITTATHNGETFAISEGTDLQDLSFKDGGERFYVLDGQGSTTSIYQYTLDTAWDVSTASYDGVSLDVSTEDTDPTAILFNSVGDDLFVLGAANENIYTYNLSTAWDLGSASYSGTATDVSALGSLYDLEFGSDGTIIFTTGEKVFQNQLSSWNSEASDYRYGADGYLSDGTRKQFASTGDDRIALATNLGQCALQARLSKPANGSIKQLVNWKSAVVDNGGAMGEVSGAGEYQTAESYEALRLLMTNDTLISEADIQLYGLVNS